MRGQGRPVRGQGSPVRAVQVKIKRFIWTKDTPGIAPEAADGEL